MPKYVSPLNGIRNMGRLYDKFSLPVCTEESISKVEMDVLAFLANHSERNTARDITEMRMLPKANVSQAVESLIQKGLLRRMQDRDDRRKIRLFITEKANKTVKAVHEMQNGFYEAIFEGFTPEERTQFTEAINKITANASKALKGQLKNG